MDHIKQYNTPLLHKDITFKEISSHEKLQALREIAYAAFPNILSSIGVLFKDVISLYFVGHLNEPFIFAAFGFGITWANAFGTSIVFGLAAGFGTLASQAFGASNYKKLGLLYQKSLVVSCIVLLFCSIFLWFTEAELLVLGFDTKLAAEVGFFVRCLIVDIFLTMTFEVTQFYLAAQNIFDIPAYVLFISTTLHIFWCHLFINVFDFGIAGMALARTITDGTSAILLYLYIRIKDPCPESWLPWAKECLEDLTSYAKEITSHGSSIYMEWIALEITTIVIGFLGDETVLAAHSAALNYVLVNSTISLGVTLATNVFVGNAAGEGSVRKAKKYTYMGLLLNFVVVSCLDLIMLVFCDTISLFYTEEPNIRSILMTMLTFYFFGMHADLGCNKFGYLLRTLGQDIFVMKGFLLSYFGVGVTISLIASIILDYGFYGVWAGLITGYYLMLILNVYRFVNLDWDIEVKKIHHEMNKSSGTKAISLEMEMI